MGGGKGESSKGTDKSKMRHKPTQQEVARRAPGTIAAVLHALKTGVGSRKAVKSYPRVKGTPDAVQTEVQNHLLKLKKIDPPAGRARPRPPDLSRMAAFSSRGMGTGGLGAPTVYRGVQFATH